MAPRKKKTANRAHKAKSHGLWIAPDLERTIKGEGGRRGLSEPPYGYYLQLADLALKSSGPSSLASKETPEVQDSPFPWELEEDARLTEKPLSKPSQKGLKTWAALKRSSQFRVAAPAKPPKVDLPKTQAPKPPKLAAPKPPKRGTPPKLALPKPPKRGR